MDATKPKLTKTVRRAIPELLKYVHENADEPYADSHPLYRRYKPAKARALKTLVRWLESKALSEKTAHA